MRHCLIDLPVVREDPFKVIAFDWDGTAVPNRKVDARPVAVVLDELLKAGVYIVVITGTNFSHVDRQFSSLVTGKHKRNLFVCTNRGSEVYGFDSDSQPVLFHRRDATPQENEALDKAAEALKDYIERHSNVQVDIIYDRLNRRKIDLIPEWRSPPKSQMGELLEKTEARLTSGGFTGGIHAAFEMATRLAREAGLPDARITSDVKHIEIGLTDKSDSVEWITSELTRKRNIPFTDIMVLGDEFGPVAGFEGSDFLTYRPDEYGMLYISVGREPEGVPPGVIHAGGGPDCFLDIMNDQIALYRRFRATEEPAFLLTEEGYDALREREVESLTAVGNGYLGTRGSLEELSRASDPATMVSGVYCRTGWEPAEKIAVMPDWLFTHVSVDGRRLELTEETMLEHRRVLDMKKGVVYRDWRHRDESGRITAIRFLRFASLAEPHAVGMRIIVVPENYVGLIRVETGMRITDRVAETLDIDEMQPTPDGNGVYVRASTKGTGIGVRQAQTSYVKRGFVQPEHGTSIGQASVAETWEWRAEMHQEVEIEKFVSIYTSRDVEDPQEQALQHVARLAITGFDDVLLAHTEAWAARWRTARIDLGLGEADERSVNFAGYHLISAGNRRDDRMSVSARALTGLIYEGHIFWDAEMFILPFFIHTDPAAARSMLLYRYYTLNGAKRKAARMGYEGALFAWESAQNGDEITPGSIVMPNGQVVRVYSGEQEHHISADVAYGVWHYWRATLDAEFILTAGAELLVETARFWASRVAERDGMFHIEHVMGPDEYHPDVDDNFYTNAMAAWNLATAAETVHFLQQFYPDQWQRIGGKIAFRAGEPDRWKRVADSLYLDMTGPDDLIEEFKGYFRLRDIDVADYEPRTAPLDVIIGAPRAAATQAIKQADVVMALYLLEDRFRPEVIKNNFLYYDRRTGHGSSLSPSTYGIVAARSDLAEEAFGYFRQAATIDLNNNMGNAAGGVHIAALGGLWQLVVMGFAGVRVTSDGVWLDPRLPRAATRLNFSFLWRGTELKFDIRPEQEIVLTARGESTVNVGIQGKRLSGVAPGRTYRSRRIAGAWSEFTEEAEVSHGRQTSHRAAARRV